MHVHSSRRRPFRELGAAVVPLVALTALTALAGAAAIARASPAPAVPPAFVQAFRAERYAEAESLSIAWLAQARWRTPVDSAAVATAFYWRVRTRMEDVPSPADHQFPDSARWILAWRSRAEPGNELAIAEAQLLLGLCESKAEELDSALTCVLEARAIRERRLPPTDSLVIEAWRLGATVRATQGDYPHARDDARRVIALERAGANDPAPITSMIALIGHWWCEQGDLDSARVNIDVAVEMADALLPRNSSARVDAYFARADLEHEAGDLASSIDAAREVHRVMELRYGADRAFGYDFGVMMNYASALADFGDIDGAYALYTRLYEHAERSFGARAQGNIAVAAYSLAAIAGRRRDFALAEQLMQRAEALFRQPPEVPFGLQAIRQLRAEHLGRQKRYPEARRLLAESLEFARASRGPASPEGLDVMLIRIPVLWGMGDTLAMDSTLAEIRAILARNPRTSVLRRQDVALWTSYGLIRRGRYDEAWPLALESERLYADRLKTSMLTLSDRVLLRVANRANRATSLLVELARAGGQERRATTLDRIVASRGAVLGEIARRRLPASLEHDSLVVGMRTQWLTVQRQLAQQLVRQRSHPDSAGPARVQRLREESEEGSRRYAEALRARGHAERPATPTWSDVHARLAPGEAIVSCLEAEAVTDSARVVAFVARGGAPGIEIVEFGRSSVLREAIEPWLERLAAAPGHREVDQERSSREYGERVRRLTWDRIAPLVAGAATVYLVPDGPVGRIPWMALPTASGRYLVEGGPGIRLLNAERELLFQPPPGGHVMLAVGSPDFGRSGRGDAPLLAAALTNRAGGDPCGDYGVADLSPLPGTAGEIQAAAQRWRAGGGEVVRLQGSGATEFAFKQAASRASIVHIATHGVVARDTCERGEPGLRGVGGVSPVAAAAGRTKAGATSPAAAGPDRSSPWLERRVWLAFAGANVSSRHVEDENEGLLTAEEASTLDLENAEWVVLSACQTGAAESWSREGAVGLRRAFHAAGARQVVASAWSIGDASTRELMTAFYGARERGQTDAGAALEAAVREVVERRRRDGRATNPFHWAAFTATGR